MLFRSLHKVAIVLAAAQRNELVITEEDLTNAELYLTELEHDMLHVFSSIGVSNSAKINSEVLSLVRNSKKINYKALWRLCFNTMAQKDFVESIQAAINAGYIRKDPVPGVANDWTLTYSKER